MIQCCRAGWRAIKAHALAVYTTASTGPRHSTEVFVLCGGGGLTWRSLEPGFRAWHCVQVDFVGVHRRLVRVPKSGGRFASFTRTIPGFDGKRKTRSSAKHQRAHGAWRIVGSIIRPGPRPQRQYPALGQENQSPVRWQLQLSRVMALSKCRGTQMRMSLGPLSTWSKEVPTIRTKMKAWTTTTLPKTLTCS